MNEFLDKEKFHRIATKGKEIYSRIKSQYEPEHRGKFLAIDPDSGDVYLGNDGLEATDAAKKVHPDTIVYLHRIGFESAYNMFNLY